MNDLVSEWIKFRKKNNYYHRYINRLVHDLIPADATVLEIGSRGGELLYSLKNTQKVGLEENADYYSLARKQYKKLRIVNKWSGLSGKKFDYILLTHTLSTSKDVQKLIHKLKKYCHLKSRVAVLYFNFLWKPILDLAEKMDAKMPQASEPNWLTTHDVHNLFYLEAFSPVSSGRNILCPIDVGVLSEFLNKIMSQVAGFNFLDLINHSVFRVQPAPKKYSVSVIVPARNEEGNMLGILKKLPLLGKRTEVIFIEGGSQDNTRKVISQEIKKYKGPLKSRLVLQRGKGKGDAVRLGFSLAQNDLLMILDADLTVDPGELPKFYEAIAAGRGELVMGSRLVYPMERLAMRNLNFIGNKFFGLAFSYLLNQEVKDTLCGTKALLRADYLKIEKNRHFFGNFDPFGDFDLIFGAVKLNMRILEIPIRYKERTYGETNINRFEHGLLLLRMVLFAAWKIKFV